MKHLTKVLVLAGALAPAWAGAAPALASASSPSQAYSWRNVVIGGGGFVTGIIFHPRQPGLMYARTDVGGAYRWEDAAQRWIPITDGIGVADVNLTGCEGLGSTISALAREAAMKPAP